MGPTIPSHQLRFATCLTVIGLIALASMTSSGCATNRYYAAQLPAEWQAQPTQNVQTLELAKIASPTLQSDMIGRGDILEINVATGVSPEDNLKWTIRVAEDGTATLPDLGRIPLERVSLTEAEAQIASLCVEKGLYRAPQVTVLMKQPKLNTVTVVGAVKSPQTYRLRSGASTLFDALVQAGGLAEDAGSVVEIRHPGFRDGPRAPRIAAAGGDGLINASHNDLQTADFSGPQTVRIDLVSATREGQSGYYLPDGTVVNVERRDPLPIHVSGLVNKAGAYPYPMGKELALLDAIAEAGGLSNPLADKVYIIRTRPGQEQPALIEASLRRAKHRGGLDNPLLAPGDYVSVEHTPATALYEAARLIGFGISGRAF